MSLINEALKKAQRQRSDQPPGMMSSAERMEHHDRPARTQSIVLLVAGAAVLVVFSVVVTVYLLNRTPVATTPVLADNPTSTGATAPHSAVDLAAPSPVIVAPMIAVPAPAREQAPAAAPTPTVATAAPIEIPPITPVRQPELHIQLWVDAIHVTGVRYSGGENKVLMNDRVYRVNDIVDRALVLKLVKVEPELLTFTDPNGMVYTKSF